MSSREKLTAFISGGGVNEVVDMTISIAPGNRYHTGSIIIRVNGGNILWQTDQYQYQGNEYTEYTVSLLKVFLERQGFNISFRP